MVKTKAVIITEQTRILLNKAKAKILKNTPTIRIATDEAAIKEALIKFVRTEK